MHVKEQIAEYIAQQSPTKSRDLQSIHEIVLAMYPTVKLWFLDGKNDVGKVVSNPNIGYGEQLLPSAKEQFRLFYQVGLSANTAGISMYFMGLKDTALLSANFQNALGKAKITGYCVKFKSLNDLNLDELKRLIAFGFQGTSKGFNKAV